MTPIPEFQLDGRVAIVTGGSRSLGRAMAVALAEAGADVVICARRQEGLDRVAHEIEEKGQRALPVPCDVSDRGAVDDLVSRCLSTFGRLDIVVANAGIFQEWKPSEQMTNDEWDRVISVNLTGAMHCCLAGGRAMIRQGTGGSIVVISSVQGKIAIPGTSAYVASKHGVIGVAKTFAVDWAKHNIRVNVIMPGFVARDEEPLQKDPVAVEFVTSHTPLGRWGDSRELALAVVFLASPAASYITGATLAVDGGYLAL